MVNPSTYSDDHQDELAHLLSVPAEDRAEDYFYGENEVDDTADPFLFGDPDLLKLGIALQFGPEELFNNREGYVSPVQIRFLEKDLRWKYWPPIIVLTVLALVYGSVGLIAMPSTLLVLIPTVIVMVASLILALFFRRERESIPDRRVYSAVVEVGWLGLTLRRWGVTGGENGKAHFTGVGGQKLFAPKELHNAMQANQIYRAYYAPGVSWDRARILSLEPIGERLKRGDSGVKKAKIKNTL